MSEIDKTRPKAVKPRWYQKTPSVKRFIFWNILCWSFGLSTLIGGIFYTENVVRPVAEAGGTEFGPLDIFEQEAAGKRVFGNHDRMNILVVGIDYNYNSKGILYTKGARSDTIIVMSLSREGEFLNVVSIPRDTQVLIANDIGYAKVNSAYSYGGIDQARETVSNFLGIPIHHHVILKVSGAKDVVDALGGLPIDVEKNMDYDDNWGKLHIHLKKGPQVLDGEQAVGYARFRMDEEGDRGRIRRQQQVVRALGRKLKEPAMLSRVDQLAKVVKQNLDTDLTLWQMVDLANLYSSFNFAKMRSASIVGDDAVDPDGISYIVPYEPENRRTVRRLLQDLDWLQKDDLRIRILYKKAPSHLAYDLADQLYDSGFRGIQVEALPFEDEANTDETRLVWYNQVPRLKGVLQAVVGIRPNTEDTVPEGRDDDLAIYLGDYEEGNWSTVPDNLLEEREPRNVGLDNSRPDIRYQPEFVPRALPQSVEEINAPYQAEIEDPETFEESMEPNYPTQGRSTELESDVEDVPQSAVEGAQTLPPKPQREPSIPKPRPEAAPKPEVVQIAPPPPQRVELDLTAPEPVATPISSEF
jgi:polyisoprenyl-teichoic acid--peptidoglycan teichoic acid transferase